MTCSARAGCASARLIPRTVAAVAWATTARRLDGPLVFFMLLILKRQRRIALHDPLLYLRALTLTPQRRAMYDAVQEGAAVPAAHRLDGSRDTDKLAFPGVC